MFSISFRAMDTMFSIAAQTVIRTATMLIVLVGVNLLARQLRRIPRPAMYRLIRLEVNNIALSVFAVINFDNSSLTFFPPGPAGTSFLFRADFIDSKYSPSLP